MSKLDAFLAKLSAKKREIERQRRQESGELSSSDDSSDEEGEEDGRGDVASRGGHGKNISYGEASSTSIYGSKAYWDTRYGDGCVIGGGGSWGL
jgi:hypothetical protein